MDIMNKNVLVQKMKTSFYSENELKKLKLKSYGKNVLISKKTSIYGAENIVIGSNVRIDDFCILSGNISIGSYVHIAAYCAIYGKSGVVIKDFSGLSPKVVIFSLTDDFSGEYMISPLVPSEFTNVTGGPVIINKYVQIGSGSIVLPNLVLGEGSAIGAMSLVNKNINEWTINVGTPAKFLKVRKRNILNLVKKIK